MSRTNPHRQPLTRERIVAAALSLADREGGKAVTMRRVGAELHVEAMSLYHHVRDREDLLDGIAEAMVQTGIPVPGEGEPWRDIVSAFACGIRATAHQHPGAFQVVGLRPLHSREAKLTISRLLSALEATGLPPDLAVIAYRVAAAYARGFALSELAGLTLGVGVEVPGELASFAASLTRSTEETFVSGLHVLLDGIAAQAPSAQRSGEPAAGRISDAPRR
ncbi:MAG: TetR/AcrR family transcriptional regulator C-terminal domain-containing protein [Marmoricola sp.]